ncbi:hypothetical protein IPJ72_05100 [Candidatus Peregrinibacteria bacterium]|nr:MAG: hypothetical protein IPJ72_05100 [Candidatus Peregrinibacteria bacterium]
MNREAFNAAHYAIRQDVFAPEVKGDFIRHINRLLACAAQTDRVFSGDVVAEDPTYPAEFFEAYPDQAEKILRLVNMNDARTQILSGTRAGLITWYLKTFGYKPEDEDAQRSKEAFSIAQGVPRYHAYQLAALAKGFKSGNIDLTLVERVRQADGGKAINIKQAKSAGMTVKDIIELSCLLGAIYLTHASRNAVMLLLKCEGVNEAELETRFGLMMADIIHTTGCTSRAEYEPYLKQMRAGTLS